MADDNKTAAPATPVASAPAIVESVKDKSPDSKLVAGEDGLVSIDGFGDTRVGADYQIYDLQDGRTDRIAVLPSLTLITKENVAAIKAKLDVRVGRLIRKTVDEGGQPVEKKFYCGHVFKAAFVHFTDKGIFRCLGKGKVCCTLAGKDPAFLIPVPILRYPTNKEGDLQGKDPLKLLEEADLEILIWKLNDSAFARIRASEKEFALMNHDIKVKGKKQGKYTRMDTLTPCAESLWQKLSDARVDGLIGISAGIYETRLARFFGRKMTELQIKELFGMAPVNPAAADPSSGVKVDDLVSGL